MIPAACNVHDLVTAKTALDGSPTWLAMVEEVVELDDEDAAEYGVAAGYLLSGLGIGTIEGVTWFDEEVRPLTDAEAITMVEGLTWGLWGNSPPTVAASRLYLAHLCRGDTP